MNSPNETLLHAERRKQCEVIIEILGDNARPKTRAINATYYLTMMLFFAWSGWDGVVRLGTEAKLVFTVSGTLNFAAASMVFFLAIKETWISPKDRLLFLLAEDFLARNKEPSPSPAPTPTSGTTTEEQPRQS